MIVESLVLGTITLTYKPPEPPPLEVGYLVPQISQIEPIVAPEMSELAPIAPKVIKPPKAPVRPSGGTNTYEPGQCTWWVKQWKPEVPNTWSNANRWDDWARVMGWVVSDSPVVGAVAQSDRGGYGHVALVIAVSGSEVTIKEGNYDYNGSVRTKTVPISSYRYIY